MWHPIRRFDDPAIPKLHNLARAAARRLHIPTTVWSPARARPTAPPPEIAFPLIVRSGSPTEDTHETSNAGQLLSLIVRAPADFASSVARVIDALPTDDAGEPRGVVFVQPLVLAAEAGIAFFDGYYFERTAASGGNEALTSGQARGDVVRGHLARGDAWSEWLARVHAVFAGDIARLDIEYARDDTGYVLLQARPALFPIARNETLSLANHKEILGDPPSPWIVGVLIEAGREVLDFFADVDPEVRRWDEAYAVEIEGRAWMNFSFFFRLMDHWGLPRAMVTQGVGGEGGGPEDHALLPARFLKSTFRLMRLQWQSLQTVLRAPEALAELDKTIDGADSLAAVYRANVAAMSLAIRTNFAIGGILSGVSRIRKACGIEGSARVVTEDMMHSYSAIAKLKTPPARARALDAWLATYGHRGPLESDPSRPRFAELRDLLLTDVGAASQIGIPSQIGGAASGATTAGAAAADAEEAGPMFWIDTRREWFRDELMKRWQKIRTRALGFGRTLTAEHHLDAPEDVFFLAGPQLEALASARSAVTAARQARELASATTLPLTASRTTILAAIAEADRTQAEAQGKRLFTGIALSAAVTSGPALKANDLTELLAASARDGGIDPTSILIVSALEPSWAVVFPRFRGVIAEIGGELSHASILLREAKKPAIVNCKDIYRNVTTGDHIHIDGARGIVEILPPSP